MLWYKNRPYRLTVRTDPSQGLNRGSIPRRVTFNSAHEYFKYFLKMTNKQTLVDINLFCKKIYLKRDYLQEKYKWELEKDARLGIFDKWINHTNTIELSVAFLVHHIRDDKWWLAFCPTMIKKNRIIREFEYEKFNRNSFSQFTFSIIESSLRTILKAIDPNACSKGTSPFENIYLKILSLTNLKKHEPTFKLMRLLRNTIHNNTFYFHANESSESVIFKGKNYKFETGKPIDFVSWDFVINLQEELLIAISEIIEHPKISSVPLIIDPSIQTKLKL